MVETVIAAIVGALSAGATDGAKEVVKQGIADAYGKLKTVVFEDSAEPSELSTALTQLEAKPASVARQNVVKEELETSGVAQNTEVIAKANELLALVSSLQGESSGGQVAHGTGIAQADRNSSATVTMTQGHD